MRPAVCFVLIAVASGCAAPAPAVVEVLPPPARLEPPPPTPVTVTAPAEVVDIQPVEPLTTPKRRIDRRAIYELDGVTEWTLANGLTVVYLHTPEEAGYRVRVQAARGWSDVPAGTPSGFADHEDASWGALRARVEPHRRVATGGAESLGEAVSAVEALFSEAPTSPRGSAVADAFDRPGAFRVVLAGPADRDWIEPVIATRLATLTGRDSDFGPPSGDARAASESAGAVAADWDDLPALAVVNRVVGAGGADDAVVFDPGAGAVRFRSTPEAARLAPVGEEAIRAARSQAARDATSIDARLAALADLYELPGPIRPARRPAEALQLADRVARTPPARVAEWLDRLREVRPDPSPTSTLPTD